MIGIIKGGMEMVGKPRYMEIVDWVKERLERKELGPGERLNSENELSELFGLSRQTVRHAIGVLEEEGDRCQAAGERDLCL